MVILAGIVSLRQHVCHVQTQLDDFRPACCPHCGHQGLWYHGWYGRQSSRRGLEQLTVDPIPIQRFLCPRCGRTCSCLPEAIPPRRWYLWDVQQLALCLLLGGTSLNDLARQLQPCRQTLKRWWQRLRDRFDLQASTLRSHFAELGRWPGFAAFWSHCLDTMPLSGAMLCLYQAGVSIP